MKANELMVGDWIGRVFDDKRIIEDYRQVDWIKTGEIGMRYRKVWSIGCIEPIPLTTEILEKNGWKCIKGGISTYFRDEITKDVCFMIQQLEGYTHWNIRLNKCEEDITFEVFLQIKCPRTPTRIKIMWIE